MVFLYTGEIGRITSSYLSNPLEVVPAPSRMAVPVLKQRRGETFEPIGQAQIAVSTKNVAAKDLKYMSSILVQKQLNILSICSQNKDLVLGRHPFTTMPAENVIEQRVGEHGPMESTDNQSSERKEIMEKQVECGAPLTTLTVRKDPRAVPILNFEKVVRKCAETYASQFRRMCLLKELNTKSFDTYHEEVETTEDRDKKLLERVAKMDTQFEFKMSSSAEILSQCENDHIANETAGSARDGSSTSPPNRLFREDDQLAIRQVFKLEELQQTFSLVERLNKIANTAKALQSELDVHPVREGKLAARVQLSQVQVGDRKDARDWLVNTAIEKAINKLPDEGEGRRVRHLVQAFESIN